MGTMVLNLICSQKGTNGGEVMELNLNRLKAERIAAGLTQDQVAEKMGWKTRTPYAKRENGLVEIGANEFIKLASILGYNTNELEIFFTKDVPERERILN